MRQARSNAGFTKTVAQPTRYVLGVQVIDPYGRETYVKGLSPDEALEVVNGTTRKAGTLLFIWAEEHPPRQLARYAVLRGGKVVKGRPARSARSA